MEIRTILVSLMTLIVIGIVILVLYQYFYGGYVPSNGISPTNTEILIVGPLQNGQNYTQIDAAIPLSLNEREGIEFSYAGWIQVNDYAPPSQHPIIFTKGDVAGIQKSPAVSLNSGRNELVIEQDTYEKGRPARIVIPNMPANKLIHLAICVNQKSFDVYINGLLYSHTSLHALPMQNSQPVFIAGNGGWNGQIGSLIYFNYELSAEKVHSLANTAPTQSPNSMPYYPNFLSSGWWVSNHQA
uniref:Lectin/glucanase superfamily protein n=1 Tax=viral metagenome TaxID=1070528 RepID=A0A6C0K579_9ZZZZ